ncbi:MAG: DMT family transporter, partial [Pseudomonadota bacterium]
MAGPVLGERIGTWRIFSLFIGASGAALVLSPWRQDFSQVQLLPVIAGFFFACNIMTLRRACRHESTLALAFAAGLIFIVSGLVGITVLTLMPLPLEVQQAMPYVAVGWPTLTLLVAGFAVLASMLNLLGNICMTRAYQTADASLLAPLDFTYLIFAAFWGKVIFSRWPEPDTLTGMALILCAGITIAWREQLNKKPQETQHG